jgi:hypothetical protein
LQISWLCGYAEVVGTDILEELVVSIFRVDREELVAGRTGYIISGKSRTGKELK